MKLLDSHHHLWNLQVLDYIWLKQIGKPKPFGDPTSIQKDYVKKDFLSDVAKTNKKNWPGLFTFKSTVHLLIQYRKPVG